MKLSKETQRTAMDIVTHTRYFCERMDESSDLDRKAKARCQEIIERLPDDMTSHSTSKARYPTNFLVSMILTLIDAFIKDSTKESRRPTIKNWSFRPGRTDFMLNVALVNANLMELRDVLEGYKKGKP